MTRLSKLVTQPLVLTQVTLVQVPVQPVGMLASCDGARTTTVGVWPEQETVTLLGDGPALYASN